MYFMWKFERAPNFRRVQYFFADIFNTFPSYQCLQKGARDFFILSRSWVFLQKLKWPGFETLAFYIFINKSRSKQNKKNPEHPFVDINKSDTGAKL